LRAVIQRVSQARVSVDDKICGEINTGYVVYLGVGHDDDEQAADKLLAKIIKLRIFEDERGKTNLSLIDVAGELLIISQFTLYANCKRGNRPSFTEAGSPDRAEELYEYFIKRAHEQVSHVSRGVFGAMMEVSLTNQGPFTITLDTATL
jgi:D-tyrosyl-tRNA(Tyr) deacylase